MDVELYLDSIQDVFTFLPRADEIKEQRGYHAPFDLYISLDCADADRLGDSLKYFKTAKQTICIDHHISNQSFADINVIEPTWSSASEVLYTLLDPEKVSKNTAMCLYTGIVHDSGVFQYSSTSKQTMDIAGTLMTYGFDFTKIIDDTFYSKTHDQNRAMGFVVEKSELYCGGKLIVGTMSMAEMAIYSVTSKDLDGIVNQLRITKGVEIAAFLYEIEGGYKASLRSNGCNVAEVAAKFGGGGHIRAAGCSLYGTKAEAIGALLPELQRVIEEECTTES